MRLVLSMLLMIGPLLIGTHAQSRDALTVLQRSDTHKGGQEVVAAVDDLAPGASTNWHRHAGTMVAFISEGTVTVEQEGRQPASFSAGASFIIPAGVPHNSVNKGNTAARMFVTFVLDKGKPLTSSVRPSKE